MKIYSTLESISKPLENVCLSIGTFDGFHLGHQKILKQLVKTAESQSALPAVMSFLQPPKFVLQKKSPPPRLLSRRTKEKYMEDFGIKVLFHIPFTPPLAALTPEAFWTRIIESRLILKWMVEGEGFRFGARQMGDISWLKMWGGKNGFRVSEVPLIKINKKVISSQNIRAFLQNGKISQAAAMLGRLPRFHGKVIQGRGLGKKLGFPTANLSLPEPLPLCLGVYLIKVKGIKEDVKGIMNWGLRPTVSSQTDPVAEIHLPDKKMDLLGQELEIIVHRFLRPEKKFDSQKELVAQIEKDIRMMRMSQKDDPIARVIDFSDDTL